MVVAINQTNNTNSAPITIHRSVYQTFGLTGGMLTFRVGRINSLLIALSSHFPNASILRSSHDGGGTGSDAYAGSFKMRRARSRDLSGGGSPGFLPSPASPNRASTSASI